MIFEVLGAIVENKRHGGCGFDDHAYGAIDDRVLHIAFAGEAAEVAARPYGLAMLSMAMRRAVRLAFSSGGVVVPVRDQSRASVSNIRGIECVPGCKGGEVFV